MPTPIYRVADDRRDPPQIPSDASARPPWARATAAGQWLPGARGRPPDAARPLFRAWSLIAAGLLALGGCRPGGGPSAEPDLVWARQGISDGRFTRPRAIAIDQQDRIYVVDFTARIQVFDRDGKFLRGWRTPRSDQGRPTGMSIDQAGHLMVADTHCARVLFYTPDGELLPDLTIGGTYGPEPGQFHFVTDVVQDSQGNYYVSEYGEMDRIQKFSPSRQFVYQWGQHGDGPGEFSRPQSLAMDEQDRLWVADACNHRVQVFDVSGDAPRLERTWGERGHEPGQLNYPYGLILDGRGHVYVTEFGNHRVQKFSLDGRSLAVWGTAGRQPGQLNQPWASALDSQGNLHILDSYNHRVQRIRL